MKKQEKLVVLSDNWFNLVEQKMDSHDRLLKHHVISLREFHFCAA
jgi:hypothetical protein